MLKLEMAMSYNRMDWRLVYDIFQAFGFDQLWIDRIRQKWSSMWLFLFVKRFQIGSSYFNFLAHYFYRLFLTLAHSEVLGLSQYALSTRNQYYYLTLSLANDMIIFTNSQKQSIRSIFYFLECYEWVSSHLVNRDKSGLKLPRWASDIQIRRLVFLTEFMSSGHSLIYGFLYLKGPRRACSIMTSFNRLGAESQVGLYDYFHTKDELLC